MSLRSRGKDGRAPAHPSWRRDQAFANLFAVGADGGMLYNNMYGIDINGSMICHGVNSARTAANTAHEFISGK